MRLHQPSVAPATSALTRGLRAHDAAEPEVSHRGVDHLGLPGGRTVAQAVVGCAEMGTALDELAGNSELRLVWVVALLGGEDARVDGRAATGLHVLVGVAGNVPVRGPLPDVAGHVMEPISVRWERADWRRAFVAVGEQVLPGEFP